MTKDEIRSEYLKLRQDLTKDQYTTLNQRVAVNFLDKVDLSKVKTLHTFLPILSKKEPDTWLIIEKIKKDFSQIKISIPRVEGDRLVNFYFENESQLKKNKWGILEPTSGELTPTEKIDLVIVPLLAFDMKGNRVGYGKGFYDKFLATCRSDCKKVGLSLFDVTHNPIPSNDYDVPLDLVVVPLGIKSFP